MALISELLANILLLVTRPFSLLKLACLFGIRTALFLIYTWTELVKTTIIFHINLILEIISWTFGFISLPARIVNAFQRESELEQKLQQMQDDLENLVWDHKALQEHFQMAVKECRMMEVLVAELEEKHDMAVAKIENLERKDQHNTDNGQNVDDNSCSIPRSVLQWDPAYNGSGIDLQDLLTPKDIWEDDSKSRTELLKLLKPGLKPGAVPQVKPEMIPKDVEVSEVLDHHHRDVALSQSLFSAILSLVVGATVWQAEDPCMPLVVALFAVVGMSLKSVVQFFSNVKNKPASDAVALLSFNWFILGTLTYPTLPRVAPLLLRLTEQTISRFGLLSLA